MNYAKRTDRMEMPKELHILSRTDKWHLPKQLRMDPDFANKIRIHAEENCRSLQHELLYLMKLGLQKAEEIDSIITRGHDETKT